jgi:predicted negative regulator of RcsB-dependent stress response
MIASLKFGLFLWVLTYIGSWFNGMTLVIIAVIGVFTLPKVYKTYQVQIDDQVNFARNKLETIWRQVQEKFPGKKKEA